MISPYVPFMFSLVIGGGFLIMTLALLADSKFGRGRILVIGLVLAFTPPLIAEGYRQYFENLKSETVGKESLGLLKAIHIQNGGAWGRPVSRIETSNDRILTVEARYRSVSEGQTVTIRQAGNGLSYICIGDDQAECHFFK